MPVESWCSPIRLCSVRCWRTTEAIRRWRTDTSTKYDYVSEPFAITTKDGVTVVTSHLTGHFPGSPVDLRFFFRLEGDKISALEITP